MSTKPYKFRYSSEHRFVTKNQTTEYTENTEKRQNKNEGQRCVGHSTVFFFFIVFFPCFPCIPWFTFNPGESGNSLRLTGVYVCACPDEEPYLIFRYQVQRIWQLSPEPLLTGGLALLPLAPISAVTEAELPGIIQRMERRLSSRRGRKQAQVVWAAAYLLLGLRYVPALSVRLFRGVVSMKESSTYQAILEEGRVEGELRGAVAEAKKVLRFLGEDVFGPPDARTNAAIERLKDLTQLEELLRRVHSAGSWQELLGRPRGRRRPSS